MSFIKTYQKSVASFVTVCFVTSFFILPPPALAQPTLEQIPLSLVPLGIPPELASIDEVFIPDPKKESGIPLIHIQSVHAHAQTQKKIYGLLKLLDEKYGISALYIEGAGEKLNPDYFRFFDDNRLNVRVAEKLVEKGELTGAELFLIESHKKIPAYGLEDPSLYRENLTSFEKVMTRRDLTSQFTQETHALLDRLETLLLSPPARKLLRASEAFDAGQMELLSYALELERKAKELLELDLRYYENQLDWPQMIRLLRLQELESKLEPENIQSDRQKLTGFLKQIQIDPELVGSFENLSFSPFQSGMVYDPGFRKNDLPRYLAERLVEATMERGFSFDRYPYFTRYLEAAILQSELEAERLFGEMEKLFETLIQKVSSRKEEWKLVGFVHEERLLERLFDLELTPKDYAKIEESRKGDRPLVRFLLGIESLHEGTNLGDRKVIPDNIEAIESVYGDALRFYSLAKEREEVMVEKILTTPSPISSPPPGERIKGEGGITILITGGFHTEGLSRQFRKKGIPYTIVSPRITEKVSPEVYISNLLGETKTAFDTQYLEVAANSERSDLLLTMFPEGRSVVMEWDRTTKIVPRVIEVGYEERMPLGGLLYQIGDSLFFQDRKLVTRSEARYVEISSQKNGRSMRFPIATLVTETDVLLPSIILEKRGKEISGESGGGVSSTVQRGRQPQLSIRSRRGQAQMDGEETLSSIPRLLSSGERPTIPTQILPRGGKILQVASVRGKRQRTLWPETKRNGFNNVNKNLIKGKSTLPAAPALSDEGVERAEVRGSQVKITQENLKRLDEIVNRLRPAQMFPDSEFNETNIAGALKAGLSNTLSGLYLTASMIFEGTASPKMISGFDSIPGRIKSQMEIVIQLFDEFLKQKPGNFQVSRGLKIRLRQLQKIEETNSSIAGELMNYAGYVLPENKAAMAKLLKEQPDLRPYHLLAQKKSGENKLELERLMKEHRDWVERLKDEFERAKTELIQVLDEMTGRAEVRGISGVRLPSAFQRTQTFIVGVQVFTEIRKFLAGFYTKAGKFFSKAREVLLHGVQLLSDILHALTKRAKRALKVLENDAPLALAGEFGAETFFGRLTHGRSTLTQRPSSVNYFFDKNILYLYQSWLMGAALALSASRRAEVRGFSVSAAEEKDFAGKRVVRIRIAKDDFTRLSRLVDTTVRNAAEFARLMNTLNRTPKDPSVPSLKATETDDGQIKIVYGEGKEFLVNLSNVTDLVQKLDTIFNPRAEVRMGERYKRRYIPSFEPLENRVSPDANPFEGLVDPNHPDLFDITLPTSYEMSAEPPADIPISPQAWNSILAQIGALPGESADLFGTVPTSETPQIPVSSQPSLVHSLILEPLSADPQNLFVFSDNQTPEAEAKRVAEKIARPLVEASGGRIEDISITDPGFYRKLADGKVEATSPSGILTLKLPDGSLRKIGFFAKENWDAEHTKMSSISYVFKIEPPALTEIRIGGSVSPSVLELNYQFENESGLPHTISVLTAPEEDKEWGYFPTPSKKVFEVSNLTEEDIKHLFSQFLHPAFEFLDRYGVDLIRQGLKGRPEIQIGTPVIQKDTLDNPLVLPNGRKFRIVELKVPVTVNGKTRDIFMQIENLTLPAAVNEPLAPNVLFQVSGARWRVSFATVSPSGAIQAIAHVQYFDTLIKLGPMARGKNWRGNNLFLEFPDQRWTDIRAAQPEEKEFFLERLMTQLLGLEDAQQTKKSYYDHYQLGVTAALAEAEGLLPNGQIEVGPAISPENSMQFTVSGSPHTFFSVNNPQNYFNAFYVTAPATVSGKKALAGTTFDLVRNSRVESWILNGTNPDSGLGFVRFPYDPEDHLIAKMRGLYEVDRKVESREERLALAARLWSKIEKGNWLIDETYRLIRQVGPGGIITLAADMLYDATDDITDDVFKVETQAIDEALRDVLPGILDRLGQHVQALRPLRMIVTGSRVIQGNPELQGDIFNSSVLGATYTRMAGSRLGVALSRWSKWFPSQSVHTIIHELLHLLDEVGFTSGQRNSVYNAARRAISRNSTYSWMYAGSAPWEWWAEIGPGVFGHGSRLAFNISNFNRTMSFDPQAVFDVSPLLRHSVPWDHPALDVDFVSPSQIQRLLEAALGKDEKGRSVRKVSIQELAYQNIEPGTWYEGNRSATFSVSVGGFKRTNWTAHTFFVGDQDVFGYRPQGHVLLLSNGTKSVEVFKGFTKEDNRVIWVYEIKGGGRIANVLDWKTNDAYRTAGWGTFLMETLLEPGTDEPEPVSPPEVIQPPQVNPPTEVTPPPQVISPLPVLPPSQVNPPVEEKTPEIEKPQVAEPTFVIVDFPQGRVIVRVESPRGSAAMHLQNGPPINEMNKVPSLSRIVTGYASQNSSVSSTDFWRGTVRIPTSGGPIQIHVRIQEVSPGHYRIQIQAGKQTIHFTIDSTGRLLQINGRDIRDLPETEQNQQLLQEAGRLFDEKGHEKQFLALLTVIGFVTREPRQQKSRRAEVRSVQEERLAQKIDQQIIQPSLDDPQLDPGMKPYIQELRALPKEFNLKGPQTAETDLDERGKPTALRLNPELFQVFLAAMPRDANLRNFVPAVMVKEAGVIRFSRENPLVHPVFYISLQRILEYLRTLTAGMQIPMPAIDSPLYGLIRHHVAAWMHLEYGSLQYQVAYMRAKGLIQKKRIEAMARQRQHLLRDYFSRRKGYEKFLLASEKEQKLVFLSGYYIAFNALPYLRRFILHVLKWHEGQLDQQNRGLGLPFAQFSNAQISHQLGSLTINFANFLVEPRYYSTPIENLPVLPRAEVRTSGPEPFKPWLVREAPALVYRDSEGKTLGEKIDNGGLATALTNEIDKRLTAKLGLGVRYGKVIGGEPLSFEEPITVTVGEASSHFYLEVKPEGEPVVSGYDVALYQDRPEREFVSDWAPEAPSEPLFRFSLQRIPSVHYTPTPVLYYYPSADDTERAKVSLELLISPEHRVYAWVGRWNKEKTDYTWSVEETELEKKDWRTYAVFDTARPLPGERPAKVTFVAVSREKPLEKVKSEIPSLQREFEELQKREPSQEIMAERNERFWQEKGYFWRNQPGENFVITVRPSDKEEAREIQQKISNLFDHSLSNKLTVLGYVDLLAKEKKDQNPEFLNKLRREVEEEIAPFVEDFWDPKVIYFQPLSNPNILVTERTSVYGAEFQKLGGEPLIVYDRNLLAARADFSGIFKALSDGVKELRAGLADLAGGIEQDQWKQVEKGKETFIAGRESLARFIADYKSKIPRAEVRNLLPGKELVSKGSLRSETRFERGGVRVESGSIGPISEFEHGLAVPAVGAPNLPVIAPVVLPRLVNFFQNRDRGPWIAARVAVDLFRSADKPNPLMDVLLTEDPVLASAFLEVLKEMISQGITQEDQIYALVERVFSEKLREGALLRKSLETPAAHTVVLDHVPDEEEFLGILFPAILNRSLFIEILFTPGSGVDKQKMRDLVKEARKLIRDSRRRLVVIHPSSRDWGLFRTTLSQTGQRLHHRMAGVSGVPQDSKDFIQRSLAVSFSEPLWGLSNAGELPFRTIVYKFTRGSEGYATKFGAVSILASKLGVLSEPQKRNYFAVQGRRHEVKEDALGEFVASIQTVFSGIHKILASA